MRMLPALCALCAACLNPPTVLATEPVRVESGLIQGVPGSEPSVTVFRGVPYAEPPVGDLRWRAPRPPQPWDGVRKAERFSANCMQRMRDSLGPWTAEYQPHGPVDEDCLYLNVWTADTSKRRPVLVYIHGGAFTDGSGNVPVYDGENLARKGIVVVTVNYRVGMLGFFTHPELTKESEKSSSGNYGLLDQVAALEWVKANIASLGGDPSQVTIAGQSAGAASVQYLTVSPLAKGLFARAIVASGARLPMGPGRTLAESEQDGLRFAESRNAPTAKDLRALPADAFVPPASEDFSFRPIVDGWFLPTDADRIFATGQQNDVPTLTGWTFDEGSFNSDYGKVPPETFREQVRQRVGNLAEAFLRLYPASTTEEAAASQKSSARDRAMVGTLIWARERARVAKTPAFTYLFTHPQPGPTQERYGAFHSSELPYVFDNLNMSDRPWTATDSKIAETLSDYWVRFVETGNPNGKGLPEWPAFDAESATTMELGERMAPRAIADPAKVDLLSRLFAGR